MSETALSVVSAATPPSASGLILQSTGTANNDTEWAAVPAAGNYQTVEIGGTAETQRAKLNLIPGTNVTISAADNSGANSTDVTINSTASGGSSTLAGLTDVAIGSPAAGQGLVYNTATSKWDNGPATRENVNTVATSGAAQTIPDPWASPFQSLTDLTFSANCTLTFPTAAAGKRFTVMLRQPASGGPYTATFPAVTWLGGGVQASTAANAVDVATFICTNGTNWIGGYTPEQVATAGWTDITSFTNGWTNFGSGFVPARYRKDPNGFVHLEGFLKPGTNSSAAFTLPAGYRPGYEIYVAAPTGQPGFGALAITTSGATTPTLLNISDGDIGFSVVFLAEN